MANYDHTRILLSDKDTIRRAIEVIDAGAVQIALVVDETGHLLGTVTDGDIRRGILIGAGLDNPVEQVMNASPTTARVGTPQEELLDLMKSRMVRQVPLVDQRGLLAGLEELEDLHTKPALRDNVAVILAGGQGTRLRPLTDDLPKPLVEVGGKPVLELIVQQLRAYHFEHMYISINYLGEQIKAYFGEGRQHGVTIEYLQESEPLGTAGPLALVPSQLDSPCLVVNGDLVTKVNFERMLEFHLQGGFDLTIGVKQYSFQLPFGEVVTAQGHVVDFREKPTETRLINAGVYVLNPEVVALVPKDSYYDMNQLVEQLISRSDQRVGAFAIHEYWMDIGTAADHKQAQSDYRVHLLQ